MADDDLEVADAIDSSDTIEHAANAIQALLNRKPTPETEESDEEVQAQPVEQPQAQEQRTAPAETEETETEEPPAEEEKPSVAREEAPKTEVKAEQPQADSDPELNKLNAGIQQLQAVFYSEFQDIKSDADLYKIGQEDPARYNRFVMMQAQLGRALEVQRNAQVQQQQRFLQTQVEQLKKTFPDYVDPVKGVALRAEMTAFAKKRGFTEDRMRAASAADILTLRDAMAWEKHQAAEKAKPAEVAATITKAREKAAKATPVQKPGTPSVNSGNDKAKEDRERLHRSGRVEDAAAFFRHLV